MEFHCPSCKKPFTAERIGFYEICPGCGKELHCCIYCQHYAPGKSNDCNEPQAEPVREKERNNRCEWFRFASSPSSSGSAPLSRAQAEALFEKLFRKP